MRKYHLSTIVSIVLLNNILNAQIGIGTTTPHPKAMLEIASSDKGLLIPRVALTGTNDVATITSPPTGLIIFNTGTSGSGATSVDQGLYFWDGEMWTEYVKYTLWKTLNTNGNYLSGDGTDNGLLLGTNGIVVGRGAFGTGASITENSEGAKMIWYPKKAAFCAGYSLDPFVWNDATIGDYSAAFGYGTIAGGQASTAFGDQTIASGYGSVAMGILSTANGYSSVALGHGTAYGDVSMAVGSSTAWGEYSFGAGNVTYAGGYNSTALGYFTQSTGDYATAMGYSTQANGLHATSTGFHTGAQGENSFSSGQFTTASGNNTTAMGSYISTNNQEGSFAIGDNSTTLPTNSTAPNQMTMRFANGYQLYSNSAATIGVQVVPGGNAWSTISDVHLKENFAAIDGEEFLRRIGSIPVSTTWNYKGQDPKQYRHYGPMAQDFYKAFGRDGYGVIGNETAINQADFDGVNFTAIQALVNRTDKLQDHDQQQTSKITELEKENAALKQELQQLQKTIDTKQSSIEQKIRELEKLLEKKKATK